MQSAYTSSWLPTLPPLKLSTSSSSSKPNKLNHLSTIPTTTNQRLHLLHYYADSNTKDDDIIIDNNNTSLSPFPPAHVKSITSTSNPFVKHCVKLRKSSYYRHSHASALVVGTIPVREIFKFQESLEERTAEIECLLVLDTANVPEGLEKSSARMLRVSAFVMKKLSQLQSTESIEAIALMKFPTSYFVADHQNNIGYHNWFPSPHRILVLEGIQDPGNLGTLIRSALAFRWGGVFLLPGCCDPFGSKALAASRGASFQLPIVSGGWHHLEALKEVFQMKMLAGHPESNDGLKKVSQLSQRFAHSLADIPLCLILGNEGHGLTEKSLQECELVSIPMAREFESLNVAVAGGIFLYMLQPEKQKIC